MSFANFKVNTTFGDIDMVLNIGRCGTARSMDVSQTYRLTKYNLEENLQDFPEIRTDLLYKMEKKHS